MEKQQVKAAIFAAIVKNLPAIKKYGQNAGIILWVIIFIFIDHKTLFFCIGAMIGWAVTLILVSAITNKLWDLFWKWNERKYTWFYQVIEWAKIYFKFKLFNDKPWDSDEGLLAVKNKIMHGDLSKKKMIFRKWHLNFIDYKLNQYYQNTQDNETEI